LGSSKWFKFIIIFMANLITEKQKKQIKTDYQIRLLSVILLMISLLGLFFLAYVIPYFIEISKKDIKVSEQFEDFIAIENKENMDESILNLMNKTHYQLKAAELYGQNNLNPSLYFQEIIKSEKADIKLTKLSFKFVNQTEGQFLVSGISQNRISLVNFIDDLRLIEGFVSVDSPISDFAKETDIAFTLNITCKI
jgi:hypothetical protein